MKLPQIRAAKAKTTISAPAAHAADLDRGFIASFQAPLHPRAAEEAGTIQTSLALVPVRRSRPSSASPSAVKFSSKAMRPVNAARAAVLGCSLRAGPPRRPPRLSKSTMSCAIRIDMKRRIQLPVSIVGFQGHDPAGDLLAFPSTGLKVGLIDRTEKHLAGLRHEAERWRAAVQGGRLPRGKRIASSPAAKGAKVPESPKCPQPPHILADPE